MKKTFFKSILCASLFVGALTSCNEVEDLYNPALVREKAKQALGLDIAPDQDWNMTSVVTANITLNEDALSDYSFRIYSDNPNTNPNTTILANVPVTTDAKGKANASFQFEMPSYMKQVYVARVDDHGRRMIGISEIQNGTIDKFFGASTSASTKAITDYELPTVDCPYTESEINSLLDNAYDISLGLNNGFTSILKQTGKSVGKLVNHTISQNININLQYYYETQDGSSYNPDLGTFKFIIGEGGVWEIPNDIEVSGIDIIVANGGTLKFSNKIRMNQNSRIIVMEGGIIDNSENVVDINIEYVNSTPVFYNNGTAYLTNVNVSNGAIFYNGPTGVIYADKINLSNSNDQLINWGKIEAENIVGNNGFGNQGVIYNGCLIRCDNIKVFELSLKQNSAFEVANLNACQFYLRENSIIRTETLESINFVVNYIGQVGENALISTELLTLSSIKPETTAQEVYIEATNIYQNGSYNGWFVDQVHLATDIFPIGEAPLIISAEAAEDIANAECVGNGNIPKDEVNEELLNNSNIYAFEDMSIDGGDYDMNDVVLKCTVLENNQISIELVAAGATKKVYAFFKDKRFSDEPINLFGEIHEALGYPSTTFINTGVGEDNVPTKEVVLNVAEGFLFSLHGDIYITDDYNRQAHIPAFTEGFTPGDAPYAICVPINWKYPKEWQSVILAYPNFSAWAEGDESYDNWYSNPVNSKVY